MIQMKWMGTCNPMPKTFSFRKEIASDLKHYAQRVSFRFCSAWIVRRSDAGILLRNGEWARPITEWREDGGHIGWTSDRQSESENLL
jgi:hypothetical protein